MAHEFRLQDPGEGIHEAEILEIPVSEGDSVSEGDTVAVIETDKAAMEIPAPVNGVVGRIGIEVGDVVKVGDVLMTFEDGAKDVEASEEAKASDSADAKDAEVEEDAEDAEAEDGAKDTEADEDAEDTAEPDKAGEDDERPEPPPQEDESKTRDNKVLATPAVRGLARKLGVDLSVVDGSGKDGRILEEDVTGAADGDDGSTETSEGSRETVVKLRSLRRTTARRMAEAWRDIPHVTHQDMIEITALERLRRKHTAEIEKQGGALTLTPFIVKALAIALGEFPNFNATFDAEACAVHQKADCNIGVALDTERGLLVPVLRDAASKSIAELALDLGRLGERLRDNAATPEDLRGATFTLTNLGMIGGTGLAPIINPPQTAIFGTARAELQQLVRGNIDDFTLEVALCLPVCLTFDHRVADGAEAARFVERVKALLDDPGELVLNS